MTLRTMARTAQRQWTVLVAGLLAGIVVALAVTAFMPDRYESSVSVYLTTASAEGDVALDSQSAALASQRAASYSQFLTSLRLADEVSARLRLGVPADELADEITVSTAPDSAVLRATVTDTSPQRAKAIADTVGTVFVQLVAQFEQPRDPTRPPTVTARILDGAIIPSRPVSPVVSLDLGLGVVLGALLGIVVAVVREARDPRIRDAEDLGAVYGGSVLAVTPVGALTADDVAFGRPRRTAAAESFRRLRAYLALALGDDAKVVVVTSPDPGEGRSSTAVQLALALHEDGRRVCLLEADMRGESSAALIGVEAGGGLSDVLVGRLSAEAATQKFGSGADVIVSGRPVTNPAELLGGPRMTALLTALRRRYDVVLVDAPPSRSLADTLVVATQVDAALLVVRAGVSSAPAVRAAVADLEASRVSIVGAVIVGGVAAPQVEKSREARGRPDSARPALSPAPSATPTSTPASAPEVSGSPADVPDLDDESAIPRPRTTVGATERRTGSVDEP